MNFRCWKIWLHRDRRGDDFLLSLCSILYLFTC